MSKLLNVHIQNYSVYVIQMLNEYHVAIPELRWSYNVGYWSSAPRYWEEKLDQVLKAQKKGGITRWLAEGIAGLDHQIEENKGFTTCEIRQFSTKGYDFPHHMVTVILNPDCEEGTFLITMPLLRWSHSLRDWSDLPNYWTKQMMPVLKARDKHYEAQPVSDGLSRFQLMK
jgi:hypothetical protein